MKSVSKAVCRKMHFLNPHVPDSGTSRLPKHGHTTGHLGILDESQGGSRISEEIKLNYLLHC